MNESRHGQVLKRKIAEARADRLDSLAKGGATSFEAYRQSVGYLEGLDAAEGLSDEADNELNGGS